MTKLRVLVLSFPDFTEISIYNSITNIKVSTLAKISPFKNPHIKIELLLLASGQNPLSYYTL
jgi:hypothetical protein